MRFGGAEPEEERGARRAIAEEPGEVRRVVAGIEAGAGRCGVELRIVFLARGVAAQAGRLPIARSPALAGVADVVAGILEKVRHERVLGRDGAVKEAGLLDLPHVAAGQDGAA